MHKLTLPHEAEFASVQRVLAKARDVIDPDKTHEDADPYVLALALDLAARSVDVRIVTEEPPVSRATKRISIPMACSRLGLKYCDARAFLEWIKARGSP